MSVVIKFFNIKIMKVTFLLLLVFTNIEIFSQTEIKVHGNIRNAKDVSLFDYYGKLSANSTIDSFCVISAMANYERDNGVIYHSYSGAFEMKYGKTEYYKDTEKSIEYFSANIFYPITDWFRVGYDYMYTEKHHHLINTSIKYKCLYFDLSFLEKTHKCKININPEVIVRGDFRIGFDLEVLYVLQEIKWHSGITVRYTI